ncbi:FCD domain-containing protein [Kordia algicida OT-1]|uniref:Regulatory protein GntR, HTH:GntR, C-terminal n=1 Tax=Kordia algicida OT-1 TaxID=391587 RepID=A9DK03_9FLAO|nr:FCD domain-containing protein [Kordia algicida]EDP98232.1 regulatory protein GntR, HTH:GntR, C-terminal [Kordia algicida OT-1]
MKISLTDKNEKKSLQNDIISKIRDLVNSKSLEEGDKLPSERILSEKFGVNRNQIREVIRELEFYGVLKSVAQSGTVLNIGLIGFNGIINEIISLNIPSFNELVETRITLELKTVCLAAERRTKADLQNIEKAFNSFKMKMIDGGNHLEEDLLFHVAIAKASKNNTLLTLMLLITPPILAAYDSNTVCEGDQVLTEIKKHENIYVAIKSKDSALAKQMMEDHFYKLSKHIIKK